MSQKLRILLVGGEDRNITKEMTRCLDVTHITQHKNSVPRNAAQDAQAVVVITRFVAKTCLKEARAIAEHRKIPFLMAKTGNYIMTELKSCKDVRITNVLADFDAIATKAPETLVKKKPVEVEPTNLAVSVDEIGFAPEQVWDMYGDAIADAVTVLKAGEKIHEKDLIDLLRSQFAFPAEHMRFALDELAARGLLRNPAPSAWMRPSETEDGEYIYTEESKLPVVAPAAAPVDKTAHYIKMAEIISGLPEGPYKTKRAIVKLARKCPDFRMEKGGEIGPGYGDMLMVRAIELGVVEATSDGWKVNHDSKMEVVLVDDTPPEKAPATVAPTMEPIRRKTKDEHASDRFDELMKKHSTGAVTSKPKATGATMSVASAVRKSFGDGIPVLGPWLALIQKDKPRIPLVFWDEAAARTIAKQLRSVDHSQYLAFKSEFDTNEWDALAWQFLRVMPHEEIVKIYPDRQDMEIYCVDCAAKFIFTSREQAEFEKRFGEVTPPKRCLSCRRAERKEFRL